jgi:hypothetical protein
VNDDPVKTHRAGGLAFAPLSHQSARGTRSAAGTVAANRVLPLAKTVVITGTDDAGIELGELAMTVDTASAPQTRVEHRAVAVELACRGTTLALTTFRAGQAFDDRRDANAVAAHVRDTGIVVLAAAVAMVPAWDHATALGADLFLGATARADLLAGNTSAQPTEGIDRNSRDSGPEESSAIWCCGESPGDEIEPVLIHRHP